MAAGSVVSVPVEDSIVIVDAAGVLVRSVLDAGVTSSSITNFMAWYNDIESL